jgi:hypothetical protein
LSVGRQNESWGAEGGTGIDVRSIDQMWTGSPEGFFTPRTPRDYAGKEDQTRPYGFAEVTRNVTSQLTGTLGARVTRMAGRSFLSPRALVARALTNDLKLSLGVGRRLQFDTELEEPSEGSGKQPVFLLDTPRIADVGGLSLRHEHVSADWEIVAFAKRYKDRTSLNGNPRAFMDSTGALPPEFPQFDRVPGRGYGVATSFTRQLGSRSLIQGSYTYQRAFERIDGAYSPTAWDTPHALNLFASLPISGRWTFNVVSQFHSGAPATPVSARIFSPDDALSPFLRPRYLPSARNSGRLDAYRRVDLGVRRASKRGKTEIAFSAQVVNIFARRNALEYDWASAFCAGSSACKTAKPVRTGLPIIPSLGLEIRW